jgi:CHASE3 domain sensor protein
VLTERDAAPLSFNGQGKDNSKRLKEMISRIAQENASAARANLQKKSFKNKYAETLQLLLIIFAITVGVLVVFGLFASGKLHMPNFGGGGGGIF